MEHNAHLTGFDVIEFRRYTIKEGERAHFSTCFETWFPEAFQQLGAIVFGQFNEREDASRFTWLRGFRDIDERVTINTAFYDGPLWKERAAAMNDRLVDHTNVLLLKPLDARRNIPVLPVIDPFVESNGAQGVIVALLFPLGATDAETFAEHAESTFNAYREAGAREAGVLVSLDVPNGYPRLPFRTDGTWLVWLGVIENEQTFEAHFEPLVKQTLRALTDGDPLRAEPEFVVMTPTRRSRLRWCSE